MTEPGLWAVRRVADETGMAITMHVNESPFDNISALEHFGRATVPMLEHTGLLGPDFVAVHCVHMTPEEIRLFANRQVPVAYNAVSNMYLGSGIAPIVAMEKAGPTIGIASDGSGSNNCQDMLETLKFSALLQKVAAQDASVATAQHALDWATRGGAAAMGMADRVGSLAVGKQADFFLSDPLHPQGHPGARPRSDAGLFRRAGECRYGGGGWPCLDDRWCFPSPGRSRVAAQSTGSRRAIGTAGRHGAVARAPRTVASCVSAEDPSIPNPPVQLRARIPEHPAIAHSHQDRAQLGDAQRVFVAQCGQGTPPGCVAAAIEGQQVRVDTDIFDVHHIAVGDRILPRVAEGQARPRRRGPAPCSRRRRSGPRGEESRSPLQVQCPG